MILVNSPCDKKFASFFDCSNWEKFVKQIGENIWWICYKISDLETAEDYGIEDLPTVVYFENGLPFVYMGNIFNLFI